MIQLLELSRHKEICFTPETKPTEVIATMPPTKVPKIITCVITLTAITTKTSRSYL